MVSNGCLDSRGVVDPTQTDSVGDDPVVRPDFRVSKTARWIGVSLCIMGAVFVFSPHLAMGDVGLALSLVQQEGRTVDYMPGRQLALTITLEEMPLLKFSAIPLKRKVEVRPDEWLIQFDERLLGTRLSHPLILTLDDYQGLRNRRSLDRLWRENNRLEVAKEQKEKAGGLLEYRLPIKLPPLIKSIVGEGGPALRVSGTRHISISGRSEWTEGEVRTSEAAPSKFPSLKMEQRSRFTITGSIGTKVKVQVDQDSQRDTDLENTIKLRYEGDEDEIVQKIEAGNTTLNLPGSGMVGYSQHVKGLFGLKGVFKVGDLDITAIASQEKGATSKTTFRAGAQEREEPLKIYDYQYQTGHYYFIDSTYIPRGDGPLTLAPTDSIVRLEVFIDDRNSSNNLDEETRTVPGRASSDPSSPGSPQELYVGNFHRLESKEDYLADYGFGWIRLQSKATEKHVIGIYYETKGGEVVGSLGDTISLKLIKGENPDPRKPSWRYAWKNVYYLEATNLDPRDLELEIYYDDGSIPKTTQDGVPYVQVFGLDRRGIGAGTKPDGKVDLDPWIVDLDRGELFFPDPQPFRYGYREGPNYTKTLKDTTPLLIYTSNDDEEIGINSRYYIEANYSQGARETEYTLGQFNIIEGSEVVTLDGQRLQRGKDYTISYDIGRISFLNPEAANPTSEIKVTYEYAPFFNPERKTLLGVRGQYDLGQNSWIGATALYRDQKTMEEKPRVGQEPVRDFLWNAGLSLKFQPSLMTTLADALPFVETDAQSSLEISAEVAQIRPNPNTKGKAYIDDFEGSRDYTDLGIRRTTWTKSSPPAGRSHARRGALIWYNPYDRTPVEDIWPGRKREESARDVDEVEILTLEFTPATDSLGAHDPESWAGVMRYLTQQDQRRSKYLEIWVGGDTTGTLMVDLGLISEDIDADSSLDTEDEPILGECGDFILDKDEDTGIDGIPNGAPGDDPDDNWYYDPDKDKNDYSHINGTEGNRDDPDGGGRPDTEDLDQDCSLDTANSFFQFAIDLSGTENLVPGTEHESWRMYRVPIMDSTRHETVGDPDWLYIEYARIWLTGVRSKKTKVSIASIQVVGNKWQELGVFGKAPIDPDEEFDITVYNTHEHDQFYDPPPGVEGVLDKQTKVRAREQSLVLQYENIKFGHRGRAYRRLHRDEDYTDYRKLKMFVHGDDDLVDTLSLPLFFLRLGPDSSDYYEYRTRVRRGWDDQNEVVIDFEELTGLKARFFQDRPAGGDTTIGHYRIHGEPSLTRIRWLEVGVENVDSLSNLTGEIWIDEMRLEGVLKDPGMAGQVEVTAKFADLLDLTASYEKRDSEFRGLGESRPGETKTAQRYRASLAVGKFLPKSWGANISLSGTWRHNLTLPLLKAGSDIVLPSDLRREERRESTERSANASFQMNAKSGHWLTRLTLNRITVNVNMGDQHSRSVQTIYDWTERYSVSGTYDLTPRKKLSISPLGWTKSLLFPGFISELKFFYLPTRLTVDGKVNRVRGLEIDRDYKERETHIHDFNGGANLSMNLINPLTTTYTFKTTRDIRDPQMVKLTLDPKNARIGQEIQRVQTSSATYSPSFFKKFLTRQSYSYDVRYSENSNPEVYTGGERKVDNENTKKANINVRINWLLNFLPSPAQENVRLLSPKGLVYKIKGIWQSIEDLSGSFSRRKGFRREGLLARPSLSYQFGFTDDPGVPVKPGEGTAERSSETISDNWQVKSGFRIFENLKVSSLSYNRSESITRSTSAQPLQTRSTTFPSLSVSWSSLETLPLLSRVASSSSVQSNYSRKVDEKGAEGLDSLTSRSTHISYSPLFSWSVTWKWGIQSTFKGGRSTTRTEGFGTRHTINERESRDYSSTFNYSFRAPQGIKFPLLGKRIRFESSLNLSLDINVTESIERVLTPGEEESNALKKHEKTLALEPSAGYSFSSQVTGGLKATIRDIHDVKQDKTRKVREVGLWVDIKF